MISSLVKSVTLTIISLAIIQINSNAQIIDSATIRKLTINGICLCNTNLSYLKNADPKLKEVEVEEMDIAKGCIGEDASFIAGKGYASEKYPGMIFQKDQRTDQISKIRLTRHYSGKLPDGKFIDMNNLVLKDVFKMYPKLKSTWGSRGCSEYWNFSDSTISFYVKIDKNKKPQFPIDEAYYDNKPIEGVDLGAWCYTFEKHADPPIVLENPDDPVFYLDSIRVNRGVLKNYTTEDIAVVTIYKGNDAIERVGAQGKHGLAYFETKEFVRYRYWRYFQSKSSEYLKIVPTEKSFSSVQYILNNKLLKDNYEADLISIDDKTFKNITIINKDQLVKDYGITDKEYGVIITADVADKSKK